MNDKPVSEAALSQSFPWAKELVEILEPHAVTQSYRKGIRLSFWENNEALCRMIMSGSVEVHRASDNLLILSLQAPTLVGLGVHDVYIVTADQCKIATMTLDEVHKCIDEQGKWEILVQHMRVVTSKLFSYSKQLSAPTAYEIICNQLRELSHEPQMLREKTSVERYIRDKTHLSRSSIMKILADLRAGDYVTIENGRLVEIKHLPPKY
ncbi:MAG TPA: helix-turn-helix domain-containing protein [Scandinavium sp.]|jgi:CRP-like cAMP-binding protein|uniref:winged helix-turn-helix transcriptional regulator n=1 Tax=Scandinavium sp. TaxID=2830653 RepID=UPI002E308C38|nr:helix-turn-helix domain-containing protein [Scandinavium sp.]HEX4502382.1 helix-turn-helix domain-containing protein [Scandinavium sp.]